MYSGDEYNGEEITSSQIAPYSAKEPRYGVVVKNGNYPWEAISLSERQIKRYMRDGMIIVSPIKGYGMGYGRKLAEELNSK